MTSPYEETKPWKDLGDANVDESFLYPIDDPPCPVVHSPSMSKGDQQQHMKWICDVLKLDRRTSKDERVYCPYCDMNNHPRFSCKFYNNHQREYARHTCTLCMANHAPFQCARAQVNGGIAKPNWARREKKLAADENREPDLRWDAEGNLPQPPLPPPGEAPPQEGQQKAHQQEQSPPCAAAIMMHGQAPTMRQSGYRHSAACTTVLEGCEWTEAQGQGMTFQPTSGTSISNLDPPSPALWLPSCVM